MCLYCADVNYILSTGVNIAGTTNSFYYAFYNENLCNSAV